jgi:hypothetical protein
MSDAWTDINVREQVVTVRPRSDKVSSCHVRHTWWRSKCKLEIGDGI